MTPSKPRLFGSLLSSALTLWLTTLPVPAFAANVVATASIEPSRARAREAATLVVTVQGSQRGARPAIDDVPGLQIQYLGPSTQVSIINGTMTASVSHRLFVAGSKPGRYDIGPIHVEVEGQVYNAGTVAFEVLAAGASGGTQATPGESDLTLTLAVPRTSVFLHETIPLTITLRIGNARIDDLQYPELPGEAFAIGKLSQPRQRREGSHGGGEHVIEFDTTITPLKQGEITLGPAVMRMSKASPTRRRSPFPSAFFNDDMRPVELMADPIVLDVRPLPAAGKPASFSGAVGEFRLNTSFSPNDVGVGDPITLRTTIRGSGSLDGVTPPAVVETADIRIYPVQSGPANDTDTRTFEQVVIPKREGTLRIIGPSFSYFDPRTEQYRTLGAESLEVRVKGSTQAQTAPQIVSARVDDDRGTPELLGRDLVFIKDAPGALTPVGSRLYRSSTFWLLQSVPLLALLIARGYTVKRRRWHGDARFANFMQAGKRAHRALTDARAALARGEHAAAHDLAAGAVRDYLAAKLDLPPGATSDLAPEKLRAAGVAAALRTDVDDLLARAEHARFTREDASNTDIDGLLELAERVVRGLERTRRIRPVATLLVLFALGSAFVAGADPGADSPLANYFRGNTLYGDERYADAADAYETVLAADVESGAVQYNLGNARFKLNDVGGAILAYERAARLIPGDPDLQANLAFARELSRDVPATPAWSTRLLVPLATWLNSDRLLAGAAACWWISLLLLVLGDLVPATAPAAGRSAGIVAVAFLVFVSSFSYRYFTVERPRWAVVTAGVETVVRYEPSENGTAFFSAKPGTMVEIQSSRGDWLRVRARDGRRGWIERDAISRL